MTSMFFVIVLTSNELCKTSKKGRNIFWHFAEIWRFGKKIVQVKKNQSIHFDLETLGVSTSEQSINFQTFLRADLLTHS